MHYYLPLNFDEFNSRYLEMSSVVNRTTKTLENYENRYLQAWSMAETKRQSLSKSTQWPEWCFIPLAEWHNVLRWHVHGNPTILDVAAELNRLSAIGTWRYSQRIYSFSPRLCENLIKIPIKIAGNLPYRILRKLPDWCVYVDTEGSEQFFDLPLKGFWAQLMWEPNGRREDLLFVFDMAEGLTPFSLKLGNWGVREAIDQNIRDAKLNPEARARIPQISRRNIRTLEKLFGDVLRLLFYLSMNGKHCSLVGGTGPLYSSKSNKEQLMVPAAPEVWRVGE